MEVELLRPRGSGSVGAGAPHTVPGGIAPEGGPSPNFVQENHTIWDQSYLAKAMLQMKDAEFVKLWSSDSCYRPYEYEKWIRGLTRAMTASHPELGAYWSRIVQSAESIYHQYLNDVSVTRVSLKPTEILNRTDIELRIENKIRTILMSAVPISISQQCNFEQDLTCAQILYRTMVLAGPASRDYRKQMHDLLTQPKSIEVSKLHDHLVMWQFAKNRLTKYGFQKPEATVLFGTLKMSCDSLRRKMESLSFFCSLHYGTQQC